MALNLPSRARAIAAFNPAAPDAGFLQPLFSAPGGDNRSFVQIFTAPDIADGFYPVTWPGRDFEWLATEPVVEVGGPALWGFQFPDGERIVDHWPGFRTIMRERIESLALADRPLLLFDIVDTLDIEEAKRETYTRAYHAYAKFGQETAKRWRDRAILEPALRRALYDYQGVLRVGDRVGQHPGNLRARLENNGVLVTDENLIDLHRQQVLQRAYEELARQLPELFPGTGLVVTGEHRPRRKPRSEGQVVRLMIVLVGEMGENAASYRPWLPDDVYVVSADHFHPDPRSETPPALTIIVGALRDWRELAAVGRRIDGHPAIIVSLSTSAATLLRDLHFQEGSGLPTISFFAPYATSPTLGRDPVKSIEPLIGFFMQELDRHPKLNVDRLLPAPHTMLVREPLWADQRRIEVSCRVAARALKAGAAPNGRALLFSQGGISEVQQEEWSSDLAHVFDISDSRVQLPAKRATLLMLVERQSQFAEPWHREDEWRAIRHLFEMRGWRAEDTEGHSFAVETKDRRFQVTIVDSQREVPFEHPGARTPGLTQAPLLIIHTKPKRDQLLIGNRGQFFHAAVEDIALMEPGTDWVWPIVRRQLFEKNMGWSYPALRLCAALIVEAIRMNNIADGHHGVDWNMIAHLLEGPDCERFISFESKRLSRTGATLIVQADGVSKDRWDVIIHLWIEKEGPVISRL